MGPGVTLLPGTLLTRYPPGHSVYDPEHNDMDHTIQRIGDVPVDAEVVGDGGEGYVWNAPQDEDEEEEVLRQQLLGKAIKLWTIALLLAIHIHIFCSLLDADMFQL